MQIKKRSPIPLYGTAAVWAIYCLVFPLYKLSHFLILIGVGCIAFFVLSKIFPGKTVTIEVPVSTGSEEADKLIETGKAAVSQMKVLRDSITDSAVKEKTGRIIEVTEQIFDDLKEDPGDASKVKRFVSYYLPTTIKLLTAYDDMSKKNISGENVRATLGRIENILDTTILAYEKQLDSLFDNQALDIETDITVLETMLKREGLTGKDFNI